MINKIFRITMLTVLFLVPIPGREAVARNGSQHMPYTAAICETCHQKDGSGNPIPNQFVKPQPELCYQCHAPVDGGKKVHGALTLGDCTAMCHQPHESNFPSLLKEKTQTLCTQCHEAPGADQAVKHSALVMVKSCVRCHESHSSNFTKLLKDETQKLCTYCHTNVAKKLNEPGAIPHTALQVGGCESCHMPHGSKSAGLLSAQPNDLCYQCHDKKKFENGHPQAGHQVSGGQDTMVPNRPFTCISCHKPHVSQNKNLLRYPFKNPPYDGTICSVCHWRNVMAPPGPPVPPWE